MASLNVSCVPRNTELLWLQNATGHRSYPLFENGDDCELKARRGEGGLTQKLNEVALDNNVRQHIYNSGFGGVLDSPIHQLDHLLIKSLVEKWHPETNTFHFPIGEATVTLQDVQVIWGLPIQGPAVTGEWLSDGNRQFWNNYCLDLLGFMPDEEDHLKGGKIKITKLVDQIGVPYDAEDETACLQKARTVILAMMACYLFSDAKTYDISLNYLDNLIDLTIEGRKAWGAAVVANLYRNLTKASKPGRSGVDGPLLLLQYWAWERMPRIAPTVSNAYDFSTCLANRWFGSLSHTLTPSHVATAFRSFFEALKDNPGYFKWTPYTELIGVLPEDCTSGEEIWAYCGPLIFWNEVEPHLANRVARQFGYVQGIPSAYGLLSPREHDRLHSTRKGGKGCVSWLNRLASYIEQWNNRANNVYEGDVGTQTTPEYLQWYHERTVLCVSRAGAPHVHRQQYPSWGSEQQVAYEALREVQERGRQRQEAHPTQTEVFRDFRDIPQGVFEYNQNVERMHYSSQNIQFPPASFTANPPNAGGAFYSPFPSSGGGYFPTPPWGGASSSANPFVTPQNYPLFNVPPTAFAPDLGNDMYQHFNTGGQARQYSPVVMRGFDTSGPSQQAATNLDNDGDDDEESDEEDEQRVVNETQRPRRQNPGRPRCGTGGHR